ncbi:hypothetical protein [Thalassotalea piscium]|uniref:General secretion pathway protein K n=1 Tax=Thalassotalea piscium TaxID=1230533 RepID=A0A7X0NG29_9GAMM|nr:hypothetical protein [Thalassotalea piscium]MBB6542764.1 general secretion pathway protein K [Thalassotalea piscium]
MNQRGIALIQVLLIVAILSVLALYLTNTARDQVKIAQWFDDKNTALVELQSAESTLLFNLLTQTKTFKDPTGKVPLWNFYSKPFNMNATVVVSMQDQAGLLSIHYPEVGRLNSLVNSLGLANTIKFSDLLLDWQDIDDTPRPSGSEGADKRNGKVPHVQDLIHIPNLPYEIYKVLQNNMSIYQSGYYNPMNSPIELLSVLTDEAMAQHIVSLRDEGKLNKKNFSELTGLVEDEQMFFYPSNNIAIKMKSTVGESSVEKEIVVFLSSYATLDTPPVLIMYVRG